MNFNTNSLSFFLWPILLSGGWGPGPPWPCLCASPPPGRLWSGTNPPYVLQKAATALRLSLLAQLSTCTGLPSSIQVTQTHHVVLLSPNTLSWLFSCIMSLHTWFYYATIGYCSACILLTFSTCSGIRFYTFINSLIHLIAVGQRLVCILVLYICMTIHLLTMLFTQ